MNAAASLVETHRVAARATRSLIAALSIGLLAAGASSSSAAGQGDKSQLQGASGFGAPASVRVTPAPTPAAAEADADKAKDAAKDAKKTVKATTHDAASTATAVLKRTADEGKAAAKNTATTAAKPYTTKPGDAFLSPFVGPNDRKTTGTLATNPYIPERGARPAGQVVRVQAPYRAELYLPPGFKATPGEAVPLHIHFHGDPVLLEATADRLGLRQPLLCVSIQGLSKVYRLPFSDPEAFDGLLNSAMVSLRPRANLPADAAWGRITLSSFSAGYAAIREILSIPAHFQNVQGIALCDSMYADFAPRATDAATSPTAISKAARSVNPDNVRAFVEFAKLAARGERTFIITRSSQLPDTYAGTPETAAYILREVGGREVAVVPPRRGPGAMKLLSSYQVGKLSMYGFAGEEADDHMDHLRNIGEFLRQLPLTTGPVEPPAIPSRNIGRATPESVPPTVPPNAAKPDSAPKPGAAKADAPKPAADPKANTATDKNDKKPATPPTKKTDKNEKPAANEAGAIGARI